MQNQATSDGSTHANGKRDLLTFRLGTQVYALSIEPIAQVIEMVTIIPLPTVNGMVEGIINVRGDFIPVVSLHAHFGLPKTRWQLHTPIILITLAEQMVGLIVDEVLDVVAVATERVVAPTQILPGTLGHAPMLRGVAHNGKQTLLILNPEQLFEPDQAEALAHVAALASDEGALAQTLKETADVMSQV